MNFIGIDVHKMQSQFCVLDEQGEVCFEMRVPTSREHLKDAVLIYKGAKVLLASSTLSESVARHLESMEWISSSRIRTLRRYMRLVVKKLNTDKRDARCLAQACKLGACKLAHRLSANYMPDRSGHLMSVDAPDGSHDERCADSA